MPKKFATSMLFEPSRRSEQWLYSSFGAELDAVQSRAKAMSAFWPVGDNLDEQIAWYSRQAAKRGLCVVLEPRRVLKGRRGKRLEACTLFVLHRDQMWRIPAYEIYESTRFSVHGYDRQQSMLLGYPPAAIEKWIERAAWERAHGVGFAMYTLLTADQTRRVLAYGQKCFGAAPDVVGMAFFMPARHDDIKRGAARLVPKGMTLARINLNWKLAKKLFEGVVAKRGVRTAVVDRASAKHFSAALGSRVELLGPKGWG